MVSPMDVTTMIVAWIGGIEKRRASN